MGSSRPRRRGRPTRPSRKVALGAPGWPSTRRTHRDLDLWTDPLARWLRALGVGPEVGVGVCLRRTQRLVAVFKGGGAYLPLDPDHPRKRLAFLLEDAEAAVLGEPGLAREFPAHGAQRLLVAPDSAPVAPPASRLDGGALRDNLAYLIYGSGLTGRPKGVTIGRSAVARELTCGELEAHVNRLAHGLLRSSGLAWSMDGKEGRLQGTSTGSGPNKPPKGGFFVDGRADGICAVRRRSARGIYIKSDRETQLDQVVSRSEAGPLRRVGGLEVEV